MNDLRTAAQQAIALICSARLCEVNSMSSRQEMLRLMIEATDTLRAALAQQAEPNVEYERGFIDGMQKQAQSSVDRAVNRMAEPVEPVLQTCNCRWDGEVQVQQCTLHQSHIDAIHEWAERAKFAERKLAQQAERVEPVAWMDPASGDVISDARHEAWERDFGLAGKGKAALFTVPLYTTPPQRKPLTVTKLLPRKLPEDNDE